MFMMLVVTAMSTDVYGVLDGGIINDWFIYKKLTHYHNAG
jgi:hypothetical protein